MQYKKEKTISQLFEEQVKKTPNNIALVFGNTSLTYKELNEKANSLAYFLREKGTTRNDLIGIMVNRSLEMIVSILAVLKSGGAYIPIDPTYPEDRINYMLENSNAKLLLTQEHLKDKVTFDKKILVDLNNNEIFKLPSNNLKNINNPEDLAYVIYTSGSTGKPKGVLLIHKSLSNLTNYCNNYIEYLKNPVYQSVVSITTMSFDIFLFETIISLQKGLKLIIANEDEQNIPHLLNNLIEKNNVKIIQTTPSRMQIFINNIADIPSLKKIKYMTLAGEQLPSSLVDYIHNLSSTIIYNGYGPSETTVFSTLTKIESNLITIGKPLSNTQIYILDENLNPLPVGVPGEIYISGDGVGKGYLNNRKLTDKSFISNPFMPNTIMYKTGDLGLYNPNGEISCLGRTDNQIKIRGLRIELGEIENKKSEIDDINTCVVIKNVDKNSHEVLLAYFTATNAVNPSLIRKILSRSLPMYMIPQHFIQLESMPYSPNGKIDRKSLPKYNEQSQEKEIILPRNNTDDKLIHLLMDILNTKKISIDDSFFELGGDSLSAINLCISIKKEFNVDISVRDIMEAPIIQDLSDIISTKSTITNEQIIKRLPTAEFYPISTAQRRIYYTSQMAGNNSTLYNMPEGILFESKIDPDKLEKNINALINRHEALRTYFENANGNIVQKIAKDVNFNLEVIRAADFNYLDNIFKNFIRPFDLEKAPLFRAKYVEFNNGKSVLLIDIHHIIFDGKSISILTDELYKLYNNKALPELKITYKDYASYENERITSGALKNSEDFWINKFSGDIPILDMPTNYPRPTIQSFEGKKIHSLIDNDTTLQIENLSRKLGVTPYMLLLSVYYVLLSKYTSNDDIIIGSPVVGRDILETYNVIGMFVNTLALRQKINSDLTFREFLLEVKENLLNSYKFQTYPFDELVGKLKIKRDTSRNPLFDTMFIYQNYGYNKVELDGVKSQLYIPDTGTSKFDLSIEAIPNNGCINLSFEYATKLFKDEFIETLSKHFNNILNNIIKNVDTKIRNIKMLSDEEEKYILYDFNDTFVENAKTKTIVELFEEQVKITPENIAVICDNKNITFQELNAKANSLAFALRDQNISRNDLVGIMVNRSIEMIVGILAVLKAGAAYIPIDPTFPQDRIEYMLNSSNAKILLTQNKLKTKIDFENKLYIDLSNKNTYSYPTENLKNINTPDDLFYVIFTSGSTGKPKGVMLMHKTLSNFTNYCNNYVEYLKNPSYDTILSITTISFDIFTFETLISLQKGLKVVIATEDEQTTPSLLNNLIEKYNITITQSTPSVMQLFVNTIDEIPLLKNIKYLTLAGEQLPLDLVHKLHKITDMTIYNGYGPSETYYVTFTKMNDEFITIGKPLDNTQIYILDKYLNPVPIGATGELYMSGDCVAKGYLNNEELTNKSFIKNPFISGTIMYKSGDLGKYMDDGNILCLGRSDHQIKIRGQRIELGEIESLISKYPNIKNVTVVKQIIQNRECISAYYIADKRIAINELRKYLSRSLPRYMVPTYFVALDEFPYTPNGKVDKKSLPLPKEVLTIRQEAYVPAKTSLQKNLVKIWEKVLNTSPIGINDNFFELGGDSILAMSLNIELLKITDKMSYSDIFRFTTIAEQAEKITSNENIPMFSKIENLSSNLVDVLNNCTKKDTIKRRTSKNILLTGATGFLGIHILEEFIKHDNCNIYCIIRDEPGISSTKKLHQKLNYYFGDKYDDLIDKRIFAVTGDICSPGFGLKQDELLNIANSVDIIINSAARVAHYGNYNDFYNSNVRSVKYMIDFCNSFNKIFYHISTIGVSDLKLDTSMLSNKKKKWWRKTVNNQIIFDESSLYIGQNLNNVYTRSKFEAESYILDAISEGLDGYILRMGNLMPRYKDGLFQENIKENAFINKLSAFTKIGMIPEYLLKNPLEFTPIDYAGYAVYVLVKHHSDINRIFHVYNYHTVSVNKYIQLLRKLNYNIEILNDEEFKKRINEMIHNNDSKNLLNNLLNDFDNDLHLENKSDIIIKSNFTIKYLKKAHFKWPKISNKYLIKFINLLKKVM